eukprot:9486086-Pyramimonas_sp.AAC.1
MATSFLWRLQRATPPITNAAPAGTARRDTAVPVGTARKDIYWATSMKQTGPIKNGLGPQRRSLWTSLESQVVFGYSRGLHKIPGAPGQSKTDAILSGA